MFRFVLFIAGFFTFLLLVMEVFFRTIVLGPQFPADIFDPTYGIYRYKPSPQTGTYTFGKKAEISATWEINRQGWNSAVDFKPKSARSKPAVAIIGDSYVENLYVPPALHMERIIQDSLHDQAEIYALGTKGTPLSQLVKVATYTKQEFNPEVILVMVNPRNLPESITSHRRIPFARQYYLTGSKVTVVTPKPRASSSVKEFLRKSRFYTYLKTNFALTLTPPKDPLKGSQADSTAIAQADSILLDQISLISEWLIVDFKEAVGDSRLVFALHPYRPSIYAEEIPLRQSPMTARFQEVLDKHNMPYLDLNPHYYQVYHQDKKPFEFESNMHYNQYGTEVAANGIAPWLQTQIVSDQMIAEDTTNRQDSFLIN